MRSHWVWLLACSSAAAAAQQQTCDTSAYPLSSPSSRFEDHGDGTVTDARSKLMWLRCAAGQQAKGARCIGDLAQLGWQAAQQWADDVNRRGSFFYNDWRLPQMPELATLTERQCSDPRINLAVFPNTPADFFWTTTARPREAAGPRAFALSFGAGGFRYEDKSEAHFVRLVRRAE